MDPANEFDFSTQTIPREWAEAEQDAPGGDVPKPYKKRRGQPKRLPQQDKTDIFTVFVVGTACALIATVSWFIAETAVFNRALWWAPIPVGAFIALGMGVSASDTAAEVRFGVSALLTIVGVVSVGTIIAYNNVRSPFTEVTFNAVEASFSASRASNWLSLGAMAASLASVGLISFVLTNRKSNM